MPRLDTRQAVAYYLLKRVGRPVSRTEIVKMLFLVDLELARKGYKPLFRWIRWYYGPFSRDILDALDALEEQNLVDVERLIDLSTLEVRKIEYAVAKNIDVSSQLNPDIRLAVEKVAMEWRESSLRDLLNYIYSLPEVRGKKLGEVIEIERQH